METKEMSYPDGKMVIVYDNFGDLSKVIIERKGVTMLIDKLHGKMTLKAPGIDISVEYEGLKKAKPKIFKDIQEGLKFADAKSALYDALLQLVWLSDDLTSKLYYFNFS